jgi:hypothetical protein
MCWQGANVQVDWLSLQNAFCSFQTICAVALPPNPREEGAAIERSETPFRQTFVAAKALPRLHISNIARPALFAGTLL